jgi:hypothetical protein
LFPAFDSGEDALWIGGPYEWFGIGVCHGDEVVDGDLQVDDGSEHASLEATAREFGEEAFDRIEPGCRGRDEVERPAGMPGQPLAYLRMLVGRIDGDDGVDFPSGTCLDRVEEAYELLVAMALHVAADDGAVEDVKGSEWCRDVCRRGSSCRHGPASSVTLAGCGRAPLDLALFVDREDDRMGGRRTNVSHSPSDRHRGRRRP